MPSSFWNIALEQEALHSWAPEIIMEQLLTVCAKKRKPGKCLYTLAMAIALLTCNKTFLLVFEEQCWSDSSMDGNFHIFWRWNSCSINALGPAQQNSAGGGNNWQQEHFKNFCSDSQHLLQTRILQFQSLGWYKRADESLPFPRLPGALVCPGTEDGHHPLHSPARALLHSCLVLLPSPQHSPWGRRGAWQDVCQPGSCCAWGSAALLHITSGTGPKHPTFL